MRLSTLRVDAQRAADRALSARAEAFVRDPDVVQLYDLYQEEGLAELEPAIDYAVLRRQRGERAELARKVFARLGAEGSRAFAVHVVDAAMRALRSDRESDDARGLLGSFPALLTRYGYADTQGRLLAPELSVRSLYKARFNIIFERAPTEGFSQVELQAYEGFNALQAGGLPPARRAEAAGVFYRAGGTDAGEALAIWLFQGGQRSEALALFSQEYERTKQLRLRNMILVAREPSTFE